MARRGLVQIYTGDGKGKTSAAMGAVLRAVGQGMRACVIQFLKGGTPSGEVNALADLKGMVEIFRFGRKPICGEDFAWVDAEHPTTEDVEQARAAFHHAQRAVSSSRYDLVVLDEANTACAWGLVKVEEVLRVLRERTETVEVILTGREAPPELTAFADLVTEMVSVKHPFEKGTPARPGVEI